MKKALMIMILCMMTTMSVMAGEDYSDGDRQQVYVCPGGRRTFLLLE